MFKMACIFQHDLPARYKATHSIELNPSGKKYVPLKMSCLLMKKLPRECLVISGRVSACLCGISTISSVHLHLFFWNGNFLIACMSQLIF